MLYELVDITNWKTKNEILKELQDKDIILDEREFRARVKENNQLYFEHETDVFIAHSCKGYKATKDKEEILKSLEDNHRRAINMLSEEAKVKKALGENYNFKLIINEDGMYYGIE